MKYIRDNDLIKINKKLRIPLNLEMAPTNEMLKIALKYNLDIRLQIYKGYPSLYNDDILTNQAIDYAKEFLGYNNVVDLSLRMTAEDFSYYSEKIPSCFYRLGTGNKQKDIKHGLHTSRFNIDERSLEIGMGLMAYLAIKS